MDSATLYLDATGAEPKLIARSDINIDMAFQYDTFVYGLDNSMSVDEFNRPALVLYPNPAANELFIGSETSRNRIHLRLDDRALVQAVKGRDLERIDADKLSVGLYLLRLTDADGVQTAHKFTIVR